MEMQKKTICKSLRAVLAAVTCFLVICNAMACVESGATYVILNVTEATIYVGDTLTLTAQTDKTDAEIVWTSDATHVAKVNGGEVTAVAVGEATVKARCGKARAYCEITVVNRPVVKSGYLYDVYSDYFVMGAAVQSSKLTSGSYGELISHYNSITAENNMKWKNVEKSKGVYNFNQSGDSADKLIAWAKQNGVGVRGHTLLWYKSLPTWLHDEFDGKAYSTSLRESALSYINEHVEKTMEHFGDDVYVWDVCNEALFNTISDSDLVISKQQPYGNIWRTNDNMNNSSSDWVDWYKVCGSYDYIAQAFKKAGEVRSKNSLSVELYYNDYGLNDPYKRQACLNLVQMLRDNGAPIDGVGMQAHYKLSDYVANKAEWLKNFEDSVKAFVSVGLDVQITELDVRNDGALTEQEEQNQAEMYGEIFKICRKYAKTDGVQHGVTGVTTWGVYDGCNGAYSTETYPLVFGTDKLPKKAYYEIINF